MRTDQCASLPCGQFPFQLEKRLIRIAPSGDQNFITALPTTSPVFSRSMYALIWSNVNIFRVWVALSSERHDLAQVCVVAPVRAVEGLFARNAREQRDIDAITDQPHIGIVAADRQQAESQ